MEKLLLTAFISFCSFVIQAQDLEPRVYANLPKDMNAVAAVYALARGNVVTDPALPIKDFTITSHNLGLAYVRTFGLAGKLSRIQVSIPFVAMSGQLKINGQDTSGSSQWIRRHAHPVRHEPAGLAGTWQQKIFAITSKKQSLVQALYCLCQPDFI